MNQYKTTIKVNGKKQALTINQNVIKLIRHNAYLMKKYNTFKKDIVKPTITTISEYKRLIESGKSKKEIYSMLVQERKNLEIPEPLLKLQQQINRQKRIQGKEERVKPGGIYTRLKQEGYKETKRILKANLNRAEGYANPLHVQALINNMLEAHDSYNLNSFEEFTSEEDKDFKANVNKISRHINRFPDNLIPIIYDFNYDLGNAVIDAIEYNSAVYMYLSINNIR